MFTGLIGWVGRLQALSEAGRQARLTVDVGAWPAAPCVGDSIAVQGVCLTLTERHERRIAFEVLRRTLAVTALARKKPGAALNLELALRLGDTLGGHLVTGHVDGLARVSGWSRDGADRVLTLTSESALLAQIVPQGAVALDGISLTVADLAPDSFQVRVIPHTWDHTSLRELRPGDAVNLETDALGKYVRRARESGAGNPGQPLDLQRLLDAGFEP